VEYPRFLSGSEGGRELLRVKHVRFLYIDISYMQFDLMSN